MNQYWMVVLIVAIVMIASVLKAKYSHRGKDEITPQEQAENQQLRQEVRELKERLHVLERIATERENSLDREIEELRDR